MNEGVGGYPGKALFSLGQKLDTTGGEVRGSVYETYQKELEKELPVLRQFVEFNIDAINSVGFLIHQNEDDWEELVATGFDTTVLDVFKGEEPLLRRLVEEKVGIKIDHEEFLERVANLSFEDLHSVYNSLASHVQSLKRQLSEFSDIPNFWGTPSHKVVSESVGIDGIEGGKDHYLRQKYRYHILHFEEQVLPPTDENTAKSFLELIKKDISFYGAQKERFAKRLLDKPKIILEKVDEDKMVAIYGEDWDKKIFSLVPAPLLRGIRNVVFTGSPVDSEGKDIGGDYATEIRTIRLSTLDGGIELIKIVFHEIAHAVDDIGAPVKIYQMRLRFLEAVQDISNNFSSYAARTYEGDYYTKEKRGVRRGLSEDFAESFAYFFVDPELLQEKNMPRYRAIEDIVRMLYPDIDIKLVQQELAGTKKAVQEKLVTKRNAEKVEFFRSLFLATDPDRSTERLNVLDNTFPYYDLFLNLEKAGQGEFFQDIAYDHLKRPISFKNYNERINLTYVDEESVPKSGTILSDGGEPLYNLEFSVQDNLVTQRIIRTKDNYESVTRYKIDDEGKSQHAITFFADQPIFQERYMYDDKGHMSKEILPIISA